MANLTDQISQEVLTKVISQLQTVVSSFFILDLIICFHGSDSQKKECYLAESQHQPQEETSDCGDQERNRLCAPLRSQRDQVRALQAGICHQRWPGETLSILPHGRGWCLVSNRASHHMKANVIVLIVLVIVLGAWNGYLLASYA